MILFSILALTLIILLVIVIVAVATVGAAAIVVFGDVIVCIFLIGLTMWLIIRKKRRRK